MKKLIYTVFSTLYLLGVSSCDVERFPYNAIEQGQSFQSVDDASKWRNVFYSQLRGRSYGVYAMATEAQADIVNAAMSSNNIYGDIHRWDNLTPGNYEIEEVYRGYYQALNNINIALEGFAKINPTTTKEADSLNRYVSDAKLGRAFYYHKLIQRFGKSYNAQTASSDLGVALVLKQDLNGMPSRSTVEQVYTQILTDVKEAGDILSGYDGHPGAARFNKDVVSALKARVLLDKKDWAGAKESALAIINGGKYKLYSTKNELENYWKEDDTQETIFAPKTSAPDERPPQMSLFYGYSNATKDYRPVFLPTQGLMDIYESGDFRKSIYFLNAPTLQNGTVYTDFYMINKFPGSSALNPDKGTNYNSPKMFRIAEMYLIVAEAAYNANPNDADALKYLNLLRVSRGASSLNVSGSTLYQAIKNERLRELAFEGFRLEDLKRWGDGFKRMKPQSTDIILTGTHLNEKEVQATDPKFVWAIPARDVTVNPNMIQNPGW